VLLLDEVITWPAVVAGAAIVAGTALTQLRGRAAVVPAD
jgi:hypothetical protein